VNMTSSNSANQTDGSSLLSSLLQYVAEGNEEQVLAILDAADINMLERLLQHRGIVTDFSGRTIDGTALQIALGAEDAEMCEMLVPFFSQIPNGDALKLQQIRNQYPDKISTELSVSDLQALEKVFAAIAASNSDDDCESALVEFRAYLKPAGVIKIGKHFNAMLLVEALKMYQANYISFGQWNSRKNNLCWKKVIGYLERQLPACYAQAFCQGIVNIMVNKHILQRDFHFLEADYELFPLDTIPSFRLGYDYAGGQWGHWDGRCSSDRAIATAWGLKGYIEQKHQRLLLIMQ
jgi:hypothetical protein